MNYLLIEPKFRMAKAPNIALMKWARWCELNNHDYQYVRGKVKPDIKPDIMLMSCVFSYHSSKYVNLISYYKKLFPSVPFVVGGAFPTLNPKWFLDRWTQILVNGEREVTVYRGLHPVLEDITPKYDVKIKSETKLPYDRDKIVLYASRGCTNNCGYCAVPRLEGDMKSYKSIQHSLDAGRAEIPDAKSIVLYDNNFTEHKYFDNIVNELIKFGLPIDIHGLHVESFTEHHAKRLAELKWRGQGKSRTAYLRFSFDKLEYANDIERAANLVAKYKIKATFFCYILFNFTDSPGDFWRRIVETQNIVYKVGRPIVLFPQRYDPLNSLKKHQYIGPKWTDEMLRGLKSLYTKSGRNFITINKTANTYRWFCFKKEDFFDKLKRIGKGTKIDKFEGDIIYEIYY